MTADGAPGGVRRTRGSYVVGVERRARIVDVATRLIAVEGHRRVSLSRIAADAGLSTSGLIHYFPSKGALCVAVAERRLENTERWWMNRVPAAEENPVFLMQTMIGSTRQMLDEPGLIHLFAATQAETTDPASPAYGLYETWNRRAAAGLAGLIAGAVERGHFRAEVDANGLAREIIAISDGLQLQWSVAPGEVDLLGGIRVYARRLANEVVAPVHAGAIALLMHA